MKANKKLPLPSKEFLDEIFETNLEEGILKWKKRSSKYFSSQQLCNAWNGQFAGKIALNTTRNNGYKQGVIFHRIVLTHRILWKLATGNDPDYIDHIDGNRSNNRIENLRSVDCQSNCRNSSKPKSNTSGQVGVREEEGKWRVRIKVDNKLLNFGRFSSFEEAVQARKLAEKQFGFHLNHGK